MMTSPETTRPIEDLVDFYRRWPDLRHVAQSAARDPRLSGEQQMVLHWMMAVVDRVGPIDFEKETDNDERS